MHCLSAAVSCSFFFVEHVKFDQPLMVMLHVLVTADDAADWRDGSRNRLSVNVRPLPPT